MLKISTTFLCLFFVLSIFVFNSSISADDCIAPTTMSCTYADNGDDTLDATVMVNYAVDGATALDLSSVVFSGNCDATAIGVGVEGVDPTHDTGAADTNPCAEGDMKITAEDIATFCTVNTQSNSDGVCDPDGTCTAGDTSITACTIDSDCDTFSAISIDCTKLIEDIDVSACDIEIGVIAESSNLHDPGNENDTNDCNGRNYKKDGDDKGHDRGKVLCTVDE
jgi:hypothetical protein